MISSIASSATRSSAVFRHHAPTRSRSCSKRVENLSGFAASPGTVGAPERQANLQLVQAHHAAGREVGQPLVDGPDPVLRVVESITQYVAQDPANAAIGILRQTRQARLRASGQADRFAQVFLPPGCVTTSTWYLGVVGCGYPRSLVGRASGPADIQRKSLHTPAGSPHPQWGRFSRDGPRHLVGA